MPINLHKPADAEIEISLFGPGTGECVVVHLGQNEWMIVDSCTATGKKEPAALEYLKSLKVPFEQVKVVVVTHFHDDHIRGICEVVKVCADAEVFVSGALTRDESVGFALAHALGDVLSDRLKPSTHEIINLIKQLKESGRTCIKVTDSTVVYRSGTTVVHALSPSPEAVNQSTLDFASELTGVTKAFRKLANRLNPNLCAIALHVCNGTDTVLLGSDLEVSGNDLLGWEAVLKSKRKPTKAAQVFKVPHHGSSNGHHDMVVSSMLIEKPVSIITTMNTHSLPRMADLERIKEFSSEVYHTTEPLVRPPKRERSVEELFAMVVKKRRVIPDVIGQIQVRMLEGVHSITLNDHASRAA